MTIESKLAAGALSYMNTPLLEKQQETMAEKLEAGETVRLQSGGDTVSISDAAKALNALQAAEKYDAATKGADDGSNAEMIRELREKIEELQKDIDEIEDSDLPEKEKQKLLQERQTEMAELVNQLDRLTSGGGEYFGGTRAEGFGGSTSTF